MLTGDKEDVVILVMFICGQFYYMFLGNYIGQKIIDHSLHIFDETQVFDKFVHRFPPL